MKLTRTPLIIKPDAANIFDAVTNAGRELREAGHDLRTIETVKVRQLGRNNNAVYVGKARVSHPRKKIENHEVHALPANGEAEGEGESSQD